MRGATLEVDFDESLKRIKVPGVFADGSSVELVPVNARKCVLKGAGGCTNLKSTHSPPKANQWEP
jgi:hypothetical protein